MLNYDECRVNVIAQHTEVGKPKGRVNYTFVVDTFMLFSAEDSVVELIKGVLADLSDVDSRVEYLSHEVLFEEPTDITRAFEDARSEWLREEC
jgi:hypothetical protein